MVTDGRYTATVDRIVDDRAVLLIEGDDDVVDERIVPETELPEPARSEGAVLEIELQADHLRDVDYRPDETERRRKELQDRFDRLAERPPGRDDRRDDEGDSETSDERSRAADDDWDPETGDDQDREIGDENGEPDDDRN